MSVASIVKRPEQIAVLSDVHGNLTALTTVLEHIRASGITRVFNLGDLVGKGPNSAAVVDVCREACEVTVRGNWDAEIAEGPAPDWPVQEWHRAQLGVERLDYLSSHPATFDFSISGRRARLFHASQLGTHDRVHQTGSRDQHRAMFTNTSFTGFGDTPDLVGYGDVHTAFALSFDGLTLFNAGSVGNPLDLPLACYAVLEGVYDTDVPLPWSLRFVRLPYDIEGEIAAARDSGMPDFEHYAGELRTAIYRGRAELP